MTALAASISGTGGTLVTPAPMRAVRIRVECPEIRRVEIVPPLRARAEPRAVASKREETCDAVPCMGLSPPPTGRVAEVEVGPAGVPQTSQ